MVKKGEFAGCGRTGCAFALTLPAALLLVMGLFAANLGASDFAAWAVVIGLGIAGVGIWLTWPNIAWSRQMRANAMASTAARAESVRKVGLAPVSRSSHGLGHEQPVPEPGKPFATAVIQVDAFLREATPSGWGWLVAEVSCDHQAAVFACNPLWLRPRTNAGYSVQDLDRMLRLSLEHTLTLENQPPDDAPIVLLIEWPDSDSPNHEAPSFRIWDFSGGRSEHFGSLDSDILQALGYSAALQDAERHPQLSRLAQVLEDEAQRRVKRTGPSPALRGEAAALPSEIKPTSAVPASAAEGDRTAACDAREGQHDRDEGLEMVVCSKCKTLKPAFMWHLTGCCTACGSADGAVRGRYVDGKTYVDGILAYSEESGWAPWCRDGRLVGVPHAQSQ